ncbi:MAG: serine/threonine protein kinase [Alphaproteobacteria bacterium]|nr:MAG: serine/threonine protein kinase [Alphaproteobacteria bacterium]
MSAAGKAPDALMHGTAVALGEWAVLLRGPSGSGKSDLALRLIEKGALLVSDDQVALKKGPHFVCLSPPPTIAGLIEARGIGILKQPFRQEVPLGLVIDLVAPDQVPRMPDAETTQILGFHIPCLKLTPFESSTPIKIRLALQSLID